MSRTLRFRNDSKTFTKAAFAATAAVATFFALASAPKEAAAQETVSPTAKGIVGGALLGAEVVTIGESIVGVRPTWAYLVGAGVGGIGGGVGGYFIEQSSSDGKAPLYLLAGGLVMAVPALVLTLNATRYIPTDSKTEDRPPSGPAPDPGPGGSNAAGGSVSNTSDTAKPAPPPAPAPQSLLDVHTGTFRMGMPVPDVRPVFTTAQQKQFGMKQETEVRFPVVHVTF
jgi:hypothetical protein